MTTRIALVDQTIRDGHQSLWGMRMHPGMIPGAAPYMDRAGYHAIEFAGGAQFAVQIRHLQQDPWRGLDLVRASLPTAKLRAGKRWNAVGTFGSSPDLIVDLFNRTLIKHGIQSFWVYDCLYNMEPLRRACKVIHDAGAEILPAIMFGLGPVLTDEFFASRVREIVSWGFADGVFFEDAAGILTPERAATLIPALLEAAQELPLEVHCHNTTGLAPLNYLAAVDAGVRILHTASRPLANGPSLPSVESTVQNLVAHGYEPTIDVDQLAPIADHFQRIADQEGLPTGVPVEYDARIYQHQLPGGMTGTLKAQLADHGMEDRFPEVLEEIVAVRAELGHPVSATPFSQIIGIQAVLNVTTSERYSVIPDEVTAYALGHLGDPIAPFDPDVLDRILSTPRAAELKSWQKSELTLDEARERYGGRGVSDEELLCRYLAPEADVETALQAGDPQPFAFTQTPIQRIRAALELSNVGFAHIDRPDFTLTVRRRKAGTAR